MAGAIASVIAALVVSGVQYLIEPYFSNPALATFVAAVIGLFGLVAAVRVRLVNPFDALGMRYLGRHTGIVKVYGSLEEAFPDLRASFRSARRISLLLHIGRQEFGVKDSLFTHLLEEKVGAEPDLEVRILHIAEDSPFLSEERARTLGKRHDKWLRDVHYVRSQIETASKKAPNVQVLPHREPFVWRLMIFDEVMYVSGYLHSTNNDKKAPVY
ncbi:MAG: hypothetical protein RLW62_24940, partial [Gammaproteobacteria bacterium]